MRSSIIFALTLASSTAIADDKAADLAGAYSYTTTMTLKLTSPAAQTIQDTGSGELTIGKSAKADLLFTWSAKGLVCHLKAQRVGATGIKFLKGQTCSQEDEAAGADLTLTLTTGSGTVVGDDLNLNFAWKLSGTIRGVAVSGSATEVTTCEKH